MKNKILLIVVICIILLAIAIYAVYQYRTSALEAQKLNQEYQSYYQVQMLGTELLSIINRTEDINETFGIQKNEDGLYIENDTNSIKIYINFQYQEEFRTVEMERIINNGIENFRKIYSTASFQCTEITYHEKTNNVKALTFTEVED